MVSASVNGTLNAKAVTPGAQLWQVSNVTKFTESQIKASEGGPDCDVKGLTSTWALADGGLVFCEVPRSAVHPCTELWLAAVG